MGEEVLSENFGSREAYGRGESSPSSKDIEKQLNLQKRLQYLSVSQNLT